MRRAAAAPGVLRLILPALLLLASCARRGPPAPGAPPDGTFSVMTYNLGRYNLDDRDGDGQKNDPKPDAERAAVIRTIAAARPDVLAVQEIGNPTVFEEFRFSLREAGLDYPHVEHLQRGQSELNLAVLSRFPIVARAPRTEDRYSIGEAEIPVLRGFIDVEIAVTPDYTFRLLVAHLKSKIFHALGQTEMRRNEARLLNKHVRRILKDAPDINLLVAGDLNDDCRSAALREVTGDHGEYLTDLRPRDEGGDAWTHFDGTADRYARIDYLLVSTGMLAEVVWTDTRAIRNPLTYEASDHRPILAVFRSAEGPGQAAAGPGTP